MQTVHQNIFLYFSLKRNFKPINTLFVLYRPKTVIVRSSLSSDIYMYVLGPTVLETVYIYLLGTNLERTITITYACQRNTIDTHILASYSAETEMFTCEII